MSSRLRQTGALIRNFVVGMVFHILTKKEIRFFRVIVLALFGASVFALSAQIVIRSYHTSSAIVGEEAFRYLANAVGITVGVAPNPINTAIAQLREREQATLSKEAELQQREELLRARLDRTSYRERTLFVYSIAVSVLLLGLVIVNFYLEYRKRKLAYALTGIEKPVYSH